MTACLIVRAIVDSKRKDDFDIWYQKEHLPDAMSALGPMRAKRGWSIEDPNTPVS